ncbi:MAG: methyltransferase domain-containing protein [Acidobacteria bacterium]|nr:methyltransferase domain-containing protein [Acidobacteriota bacterium]
MAADNQTYIHGTEPEEQARLSLLNEILNTRCLRELALQGGERILDVGSGLGQFTRAMAETGASAVAIERSPAQLARAVPHPRIDFRQGDANQFPLRDEEWGTFDLVHARFVLEHVHDPLAVVRQMARAARPGGRLVLADDDHDILRLHPEPPGFAPLWIAYMRCFDRLGCDPWIGRRLVTLLHQAGAKPSRTTWIQFGSCAGDRAFPAYAGNMIGVIVGAREETIRQGLITGQAFDLAVAELRSWALLPDAALWYGMSWAEGVV